MKKASNQPPEHFKDTADRERKLNDKMVRRQEKKQ